jgi:hypothetical protein
MNRDAWKEMNLLAPDEGGSTLTEAERSEKFYTMLETEGRWITNGDDTGIMLVYERPNGTTAVPLNKNGKPIRYSFIEIVTKPDKRTSDHTSDGMEIMTRKKEKMPWQN